MVRQHHRPNGHEFEQALRDGEGQGSLACCSPWVHRVRHDVVTEQVYRKASKAKQQYSKCYLQTVDEKRSDLPFFILCFSVFSDSFQWPSANFTTIS